MVKVAFDAGHGLNTPGKQTPTGEKEWSFNDKVVRAAMLKLTEYQDVQMLRTDDPSGRVDAPLAARTNQANDWKADILVSIHHNADQGVWDDHEGAETYVFIPMSKNPKSKKLADCVHPRIVKAMQARDRGIKDKNLHMLRESNMPAILTEGGFMDSRTDIKKMRNDKFLKAQGEAIALGIVEYFDLKAKPLPKPEIVKVAELRGIGKVLINTDGLSLRGGAGLEHKLIREMKKGDSYYAYEKVGMWYNLGANQWASEGVAKNHLTFTPHPEPIVVKPVVTPVAKPVVKPVVKGKLFKVQVGAFGEKANADRLAKELQSKGYTVYIVEDYA